MKNRDKSIELLNQAIADEIAAVHQYMYFHFRLSDLGYTPLSNLLKQTAIPIADIVAGMFAAYAVMIALFHRERTGQGQSIDTSLLDGQIALLGFQAQRYFLTGKPRNRKA